jgi:ABC-type multidrug transport system permease subunit
MHGTRFEKYRQCRLNFVALVEISDNVKLIGLLLIFFPAASNSSGLNFLFTLVIYNYSFKHNIIFLYIIILIYFLIYLIFTCFELH